MTPLQCLFCDQRNPAGAKFCNECGTPLHFKPCPQCDGINGRFATGCYRCGAAFPTTTSEADVASYAPGDSGADRDDAAHEDLPAFDRAMPEIEAPTVAQDTRPGGAAPPTRWSRLAPATLIVVSLVALSAVAWQVEHRTRSNATDGRREASAAGKAAPAAAVLVPATALRDVEPAKQGAPAGSLTARPPATPAADVATAVVAPVGLPPAAVSPAAGSSQGAVTPAPARAALPGAAAKPQGKSQAKVPARVAGRGSPVAGTRSASAASHGASRRTASAERAATTRTPRRGTERKPRRVAPPPDLRAALPCPEVTATLESCDLTALPKGN